MLSPLPSRLAERQGIHPRLLQPLRGLYRELRRQFVTASHVRTDFAPLSGIIQGCHLGVLLLDLLMNTWARSVRAGTVTAMPKIRADDAGVLTAKPERRKKAKAWGTTETAMQSARDFVLNGEHFDFVKKLKPFGIQPRCAEEKYPMMLQKTVFRKASQFPGPFDGHHCHCKRMPA